MVLAGMALPVSATFWASLGPAFDNVTVYVMVSPASMGPAVAVWVADRSASVAVRLVRRSVIVGGIGVARRRGHDDRIADCRPGRRARRYQEHHGEACDAPEASVAIVPAIGRRRPGRELVRVKAGPEVWVTETNVVLAGTRPEAATFWASSGPVFAIVTV